MSGHFYEINPFAYPVVYMLRGFTDGDDKWFGLVKHALVAIHQHIPNLKRLKAIGMDAGTKDISISAATKELDKALADYGIAHFYESYDGDHLNRQGAADNLSYAL